MNKICTSIEQSHKLINLDIDISTSDMRYGYVAPYEFSDSMYDGGYDPIPYHKDFFIKNPMFSMEEYDGELFAWSLTALFKILPYSSRLERGSSTELYCVTLPNELKSSDWYIEPIDAVFEMVVWLKENGKL